jgi:hypothetical protein
MSCSSMINWEESGSSQLARTALNLSQLCRREASDLAFHRKAVARKMTGPIHTEVIREGAYARFPMSLRKRALAIIEQVE